MSNKNNQLDDTSTTCNKLDSEEENYTSTRPPQPETSKLSADEASRLAIAHVSSRQVQSTNANNVTAGATTNNNDNNINTKGISGDVAGEAFQQLQRQEFTENLVAVNEGTASHSSSEFSSDTSSPLCAYNNNNIDDDTSFAIDDFVVAIADGPPPPTDTSLYPRHRADPRSARNPKEAKRPRLDPNER